MRFSICYHPMRGFLGGKLKDGCYHFVASPNHPRTLFFQAVSQLNLLPKKGNAILCFADGDQIPWSALPEVISVIVEEATPLIKKCQAEVPVKQAGKQYDEITLFNELVWVEKTMLRPETQSILKGLKMLVVDLEKIIAHRSDLHFFIHPDSTRPQRLIVRLMKSKDEAMSFEEIHEGTYVTIQTNILKQELETLEGLGIIEQVASGKYQVTFRGVGFI